MTKIMLRGEPYPALFDLAAIKELQDRYGDLTAMNEKLLELDELAYTVAAMIREGVALENELKHTDREAPSVEVVRKLLTFADMTGQSSMIEVVKKEIVDFWGGEKNAPSPTQTVKLNREMRRSKSKYRTR